MYKKTDNSHFDTFEPLVFFLVLPINKIKREFFIEPSKQLRTMMCMKEQVTTDDNTLHVM